MSHALHLVPWNILMLFTKLICQLICCFSNYFQLLNKAVENNYIFLCLFRSVTFSALGIIMRFSILRAKLQFFSDICKFILHFVANQACLAVFRAQKVKRQRQVRVMRAAMR